mmetsp:Transcript_24612/g.82392  ORF Transcript_24612/g.82392 Transcript_24612/m.82392 type:complete len:230 (+) Transcript_24612:629-1318(+)
MPCVSQSSELVDSRPNCVYFHPPTVLRPWRSSQSHDARQYSMSMVVAASRLRSASSTTWCFHALDWRSVGQSCCNTHQQSLCYPPNLRMRVGFSRKGWLGEPAKQKQLQSCGSSHCQPHAWLHTRCWHAQNWPIVWMRPTPICRPCANRLGWACNLMASTSLRCWPNSARRGTYRLRVTLVRCVNLRVHIPATLVMSTSSSNPPRPTGTQLELCFCGEDLYSKEFDPSL